MLLDIGRAADAKRYVEEALAADPDNTALRILLVRCLIAADQERVALPVVDRLVAESPEWDYLYRLRAIVLTGLGKSAEATRAARRAVALGAEDAWNYYQLAVVLNNAAGRALSGSETKAKKQEAARKAAERAVALQPEDQLGSMGNPPRKSQTPQQRKIRSRIWMIFIVGFVLVRAVACVASGAHHNPLPATNNSHVSAGDYARQLQIGRCAQATGDRVWSPITITDCADPRAVFRVATLSTPTCPNAAYYQYLSGGSAFSTPCLAKNLREAMCYQWPGYGSGRTLDLSAKNVPCGDPRAHLKVEKRVDGQGPLVCPPSQTMETFPVPAPGVAYCLSDPNP